VSIRGDVKDIFLPRLEGENILVFQPPCVREGAANAAVKHKGSIFEIVYRRLLLRLGHNKTIGAIAHRLCQLIWIILHNGARYEERGPTVGEKAKRARRHALRE